MGERALYEGWTDAILQYIYTRPDDVLSLLLLLLLFGHIIILHACILAHA